MPARSTRATAPRCLLLRATQAIDKQRRHGGTGASVGPEFMPQRNCELIGIRGLSAEDADRLEVQGNAGQRLGVVRRSLIAAAAGGCTRSPCERCHLVIARSSVRRGPYIGEGRHGSKRGLARGASGVTVVGVGAYARSFLTVVRGRQRCRRMNGNPSPDRSPTTDAPFRRVTCSQTNALPWVR